MRYWKASDSGTKVGEESGCGRQDDTKTSRTAPKRMSDNVPSGVETEEQGGIIVLAAMDQDGASTSFIFILHLQAAASALPKQSCILSRVSVMRC